MCVLKKTKNINEIINNIKYFIQIGDELFSIVEQGSKCVLVCDPELLGCMILRLSEYWRKIIEDIQDTAPQFLDKLNECIQWMDELEKVYCKAYDRYRLSGSSGNCADFSGLCYLQEMYCEWWEKIWHVSVRLIDELEGLEYVTSMSIVYASPEMMSAEFLVEKNTEQYPILHADIIGENLMQEDSMMREVYGSPDMMFGISKVNCLNDKVPANNTSEKQGTFCIYCGKNYSNQSGFCDSCGKKNIMIEDSEVTVKFCRNCGMDVPMIAKYCSWCGNLVDSIADAKELSKMNIFSRIFKRNK